MKVFMCFGCTNYVTKGLYGKTECIVCISVSRKTGKKRVNIIHHNNDNDLETYMDFFALAEDNDSWEELEDWEEEYVVLMDDDSWEKLEDWEEEYVVLMDDDRRNVTKTPARGATRAGVQTSAEFTECRPGVAARQGDGVTSG